MKRNKKTIIIISIISVILVLAVAGGILAYLYIKTDIFKSNQELFVKYFSQEVEEIQKILDIETIKAYENLENENKYISNINAKVTSSEGGEVSNPLNNLSVKLNIQNDREQQYLYGDAQILYENEIYLESEIIKDEGQYGIRFPGVKQFVTIENDENVSSIEESIGIEKDQLQKTLDIIDGTDEISFQNTIDELKENYIDIISTEIAKGTFEKQNNAMITYNNETTETNAYSVLLTSEQVNKIITELSIDIPDDFETPTMKMTIYVQDKLVIRTVVEFDVDKVTIENVEEEGKTKLKIVYLKWSDEQASEYKFEIIKENQEKQENFEINGEIIQGEENYTISIISNMQIVNNNIEHDLEINHKQDITTTSLVLENIVNTETDFKQTQKLETGNYISLTAIKDQTKRQELIDLLKEIVPQNVIERTMQLLIKLGMKETDEGGELVNPEEENFEEEMSQTEMNKFNAKFEFYTGEEVSAENTKMLLDIVKNDLASYEITESQTEKNKINIKLNIEKDTINENGINEILGKIKDDAKYKILISYQHTKGLIEYITITEI